MKTLIRWLVLLALFVISRFWIIQHPPALYSDVKQDYERYANQWRYGLTPYREIMFEYPPVVIPLIALPLELDQRGIGNYYLNYRVQIAVIEFFLFLGLVRFVFALSTRKWQKWMSILFYLGIGMWVKDYWFEGIDLVFMSTFTLALVMHAMNAGKVAKKEVSSISHSMNRVVVWMFFWLSVGIKILTFPLGFIFFFPWKKDWKKELLHCAIGFFIIWGIPLVMFRSSLSVFLTFHAVRPIKYSSFSSYVTESINRWTFTEKRLDKGPDYPLQGPVSDKVAAIQKVVFPIAVTLALLFGVRKLIRSRPVTYSDRVRDLVSVSLVYFFTLFITAKTFSAPFHIWYVPLLVVFPFRSVAKHLLALFLAWMMLGMDTTPYLDVKVKSLIMWRDSLRFLPMFGMLYAIVSREMKHA